MTPPLLARVIVETSSLVFTDCDSFFISASLYLKRFLFWNALLCASFYSLLFTKSPLHHGTFREDSRYNSETKNEKKGRIIQKRIQCAKNPPPHFPRRPILRLSDIPCFDARRLCLFCGAASFVVHRVSIDREPSSSSSSSSSFSCGALCVGRLIAREEKTLLRSHREFIKILWGNGRRRRRRSTRSV